MPIVISNASPLIGLSSINCLHILKELWNEIIIPEAVYNEVVVDASGKPNVDRILDACNKWLKITVVKNKQEVDVLKAILDEGESEVIALAQELNADLVLIDNREPRIFARAVNLKIIGTIGIIKLAWKKGLIKDPLKEIYKLRLNGFWIDDGLIEQIKKDITGKF
jgi:predicted nucleic acid-binding protein